MLRSRRNLYAYLKYRRTQGPECIFCNIPKEQLVSSHKHFYVAINRFPYSVWDYCKVVDHLMLIPNEHIITHDQMSGPAGAEYLKIVGEYEKQGYNVYTRGVGSTTKSIPHLHTHLIKTDNRVLRWALFLSKPYTFLHK